MGLGGTVEGPGAIGGVERGKKQKRGLGQKFDRA